MASHRKDSGYFSPRDIKTDVLGEHAVINKAISTPGIVGEKKLLNKSRSADVVELQRGCPYSSLSKTLNHALSYEHSKEKNLLYSQDLTIEHRDSIEGPEVLLDERSTTSSVESFGQRKQLKRLGKPLKDAISHRITEKRRRDRLNTQIATLNTLIPHHYWKKSRGRLEKCQTLANAIAYIVELTSSQGSCKMPASIMTSKSNDLSDTSVSTSSASVSLIGVSQSSVTSSGSRSDGNASPSTEDIDSKECISVGESTNDLKRFGHYLSTTTDFSHGEPNVHKASTLPEFLIGGNGHNLYKFKSNLKHRFTNASQRLTLTNDDYSCDKNGKVNLIAPENEPSDNSKRSSPSNMSTGEEEVKSEFRELASSESIQSRVDLSGFLLSYSGNFYNPFTISTNEQKIDFENLREISHITPQILHPISIYANIQVPTGEQSLRYENTANLDQSVNVQRSESEDPAIGSERQELTVNKLLNKTNFGKEKDSKEVFICEAVAERYDES